MNCYRCNAENETSAHFCRQCGADLWAVPVAKDDGSRKSLRYVLILMCWEYFTYLVWLAVPRLINPLGFNNGYRGLSMLYTTLRWSMGGISLILLVVFAILSTNTMARILLIVFAVLRLGLLLAYGFH